jgi:hypothetical protein
VYNTDISRKLDLTTEVDTETGDIRNLCSTADDHLEPQKVMRTDKVLARDTSAREIIEPWN